jgi:hypothetical protein
MRRSLAVAAALTIALIGTAQAHHKPGHHIPPGQMKKVYDPAVVIPPEVEFVCVITTEIAGDPNSRVLYSRWLPRAEAEAAADLGTSFVIYHPDFNTERGCVGF